MGSLALNGPQATPDHRDRIILSLEQENRELKEQLRDARQETASVRNESARGSGELRRILTPLHQALKLVFGELDAIAPDTAASQSGAVPAKNQAVWDSWKQRLGGQKAKCIDAFLTHGALTQTQLRVIIGCATSSVPGLISDLRQVGLLEKNGNKFSLKEL